MIEEEIEEAAPETEGAGEDAVASEEESPEVEETTKA